jgi:hypothetical protein
MNDDETAASDQSRQDADQKVAGADSGPAGKSVAWLDRWWVWALAGLALAALIGLLDITSTGTGN